MTPVEFLAARWNEEEAGALAATGTVWAWEATGDKDSSWAVGHVEDEDERPLSGRIEHGQGVVIDGVCESINGRLADAAHIAYWSPARVLADVEMKRAILAEHAPYTDEDGVGAVSCSACGVAGRWWDVPWPCTTVLTLLRRYRSNPEYEESWG